MGDDETLDATRGPFPLFNVEVTAAGASFLLFELFPDGQAALAVVDISTSGVPR